MGENITESKHIGIVRIRDEARLRYNPLKNLTPQKITAAMDAFNYGYLSEAARIYDAIRRRDAVVQACVQKPSAPQAGLRGLSSKWAMTKPRQKNMPRSWRTFIII